MPYYLDRGKGILIIDYEPDQYLLLTDSETYKGEIELMFMIDPLNEAMNTPFVEVLKRKSPRKTRGNIYMDGLVSTGK